MSRFNPFGSFSINVQGETHEIHRTTEWTRLVFVAEAVGARISTNQSSVSNGVAGFPLPVDTPVELILEPEITLYFGGPIGTTLNMAVQPIDSLLRLTRNRL